MNTQLVSLPDKTNCAVPAASILSVVAAFGFPGSLPIWSVSKFANAKNMAQKLDGYAGTFAHNVIV